MTPPMLLSAPTLSQLTVPHAFSTRVGGVSLAPFDSLNFGNPSELPAGVGRDPRECIAANFERAAATLGCAERKILQVHQVHGAVVHVAKRGDAPAPPITWGDVKADAIVTDDPGVLAVIRVADCTPVLLASSDGRVVGAVHAGWRGVVAGVLKRAMEEMRALGASAIVAAIGPCIGADEFEVGPEVVEVFRREFGNDPRFAWDVGGGKGRVDLKACLAHQASVGGAVAVDVLPYCTVRDASLFFSHRRDKGVTGRMIGMIGPRE
ncbi:MAG: polyphenol oxidase family protein [Phycisphaerales bacterium]